VYSTHEKSWNALKPSGEIIKLSSFKEGFYIVYMHNGEEVKIDPLQSKKEGLAVSKEQTDCYYLNGMIGLLPLLTSKFF
jgi:hypothetical protein